MSRYRWEQRHIACTATSGSAPITAHGRRRPAPLRPLLSAVALATLAGSIMLAAPAPAAVTHHFLSKITEVPAKGPKGESIPLSGPISVPRSVTVDSGNLWVSEYDEAATNWRVDEFNASTGAFLSQLTKVEGLAYIEDGVAVGHSTGETELYVGADSYPEGGPVGSVAVFDTTGERQNIWTGTDTPQKTFGCFDCGGAGDVAVDRSTSLEDWAAGDVYVASPLEKVVDVFKPEAAGKEKYVTQLTGISPSEAFNRPEGVAVDEANGDVVVNDSTAIDIFKPTVLGQYEFVRRISGTPGGAFQGESILGIAVGGGEGNGDIYVVQGSYPQYAVYQFGSEGAYLGQLQGGSQGEPLTDALSVAVGPESHDVQVGVPGAVDLYGPDLVIPDVAITPASAFKPTGHGQIEATLKGTVNPDKAGAANCKFLWGASPSLGEEVPCSAGVPEGSSPVAVSAGLSGLAPDTTYYYRLQASNANGTNPGEPLQDTGEFTTPGPGLHGETVSAARAESVTFVAKLNPHNVATSYYFQYGTGAEYTSAVPAAPGASIGSVEGDVEATQHVQGLSAVTTYHYRVVAVSELQVEVSPGKFETEVESFYGPDQTFRTQTIGLPFALPDGRAWEMVSPPQKEGATFSEPGEDQRVQASSTGNAVTDSTFFEPTEAEPAGSNWLVSAFFGRGPGGWTSKTLAPPHLTGVAAIGNGDEYPFFSADLSKAILQPFGNVPPLSPEASEPTPYLRTDYLNGNTAEICTEHTEEVSAGTHCYQPLVSGCPPPGKECKPAVQEHADVPAGTVFGEEPGGTCKAIRCGPYFEGASPDLSHVVIRSFVGLTPGTSGGLYEWAAGKLTFVGEGELSFGVRGGDDSVIRTVSADGSHVIFTGESEGLSGLLVRDTVSGKTVKLDAVQSGSGSGEAAPRFQSASSDGSRVFFSDTQALLEGAGAFDLYECRIVEEAGTLKCVLSDLAPGVGRVPPRWNPVPGVSEDGSYVYFFGGGGLAPGAPPGGNDLYVRHEGRTTFIAELSEEDGGGVNIANNWYEGKATTRVSPNGRYIAFMSNRNLTGYDTTDANTKLPDEEVYLYDALENRLVCASCNPTGARPVGSESVAAFVPPTTSRDLSQTNYQSRYLSNRGRLFFNSRDALVPQDVNGAQDVYEYEPVGVGDCVTTRTTYSEKGGGCVSLISSGASNVASTFLDASETGGDVFFLTAAKLVPQDFDDAPDIYDAHECTPASPCIAPAPAAPPPCETADSCKASPSPQPALFGAPASATFSGTGNFAPAPVLSGQARGLTRAQKRARALRVCRRMKRKRRRRSCERSAKVRYGRKAAHQARKSSRSRTGR